MPFKVGIGYSTQREGQRAVEEALAQALEVSGEPVLTFLFTSDSYDHQEVLREVRARVGNSRIAGFCCGVSLWEGRCSPRRWRCSPSPGRA